MTLPPTLTKILHWLDDNILIVLAGFLIAFIPLYPKLPLFEAIPGYIVRVRLEDILILFTAILWLIQALRKKIVWRTPIFWLIVAYAVVGLLSVISAVVITRTVPAETLHIGKTALHYFRYLEYFSLFVIVFSAIRTKQQVKILLAVFALTVLAIVIYGIGQKYYYWPVYSTMNREFSKGLRLYLTEHARVQSTFGGHYDLAAYLVVILPVLLALGFLAKRIWLKAGLFIIQLLGLWLLIVSASRTSFVAYFVGVVIVVTLIAAQQAGWLHKIWWWLSRLFVVGAISTIMMLSFGEDIYERFLQVLQGYPELHQTYHDLNRQRKDAANQLLIVFSFIPGLPEPRIPDNAISTDQLAQQVLVPSDQRPTTSRPSDVYVDVPDIVEVATISATGAATTIQVERDRTYSECALQYGLSLCIRLDTLWPRAIDGFKRNPLLGSGYATLTKESVVQFTEAESTDNNFLRTLGETGLLGFITFYGVVVLTLVYSVRHLRDKDALARALSVGYIAGSIGLLINAVYIDVYAASKVALSYWALAGLVVAYFILIEHHPSWASQDFVQPQSKQPKSEPEVVTPKPKKKKRSKSQRFANA